MGKFASVFGAATLAVSFAVSSLAPANAAPLVSPPSAAESANNVVKVRDPSAFDYSGSGHDRWDRRGRHFRGDGYYRGHRGYRHYRHGYRRHNGWWYPAGAFVAGAIIGSAIQGPRYYEPRRAYRRSSSAHVSWCYNRYRSYREWDNTYQPYNGPRQQCYSPYSY